MLKSAENVRQYWIAALLLLATGLSLSLPARGENALGSVRIQSLLDFNAILITEVDVVFVYDEAVAAQLPTTKGEWYAQKYDLLKEGSRQVDVVTTPVPQGFVSDSLIMPENSRAAVRVFAVGYHEAQGTPVHDLTDFESALIEIDHFGIRVSSRN